MNSSAAAARWTSALWGIQKRRCEPYCPTLEQNQYETHLKESLEQYHKARKSLDDLATGDSC